MQKRRRTDRERKHVTQKDSERERWGGRERR